MPEFRYAKGRIIDSLRFISEEMTEFQDDYAPKNRSEYEADRKLQKLIDRTVENILTALIEVCGTFLTQQEIYAESYADVLRKSAQNLGLNSEDQESLAKLAFVRNRLAHRYLNFRWQAIQDFSLKRDVMAKVLSALLKREEETL